MRSSVVAIAGVAMLCAASVSNAELVINGSFENPTSSPWLQQAGGFGSLFGLTGNAARTGVRSAYFANPFGRDDHIYQNLATTAASSYQLSFWVLNNQAGADHLRVLWEGVQIFDQLPLSIPLGVWTQVSLNVNATQNGSQLRFSGFDMPDRFYIDDVSVVNVPAPGAALFMALAGAAAARRQRRGSVVAG